MQHARLEGGVVNRFAKCEFRRRTADFSRNQLSKWHENTLKEVIQTSVDRYARSDELREWIAYLGKNPDPKTLHRINLPDRNPGITHAVTVVQRSDCDAGKTYRATPRRVSAFVRMAIKAPYCAGRCSKCCRNLNNANIHARVWFETINWHVFN